MSRPERIHQTTFNCNITPNISSILQRLFHGGRTEAARQHAPDPGRVLTENKGWEVSNTVLFRLFPVGGIGPLDKMYPIVCFHFELNPRIINTMAWLAMYLVLPVTQITHSPHNLSVWYTLVTLLYSFYPSQQHTVNTQLASKPSSLLGHGERYCWNQDKHKEFASLSVAFSLMVTWKSIVTTYKSLDLNGKVTRLVPYFVANTTVLCFWLWQHVFGQKIF